MLPAPSLDKLTTAFPEVSNLRAVAHGGFKYVYKAAIGGRTEAFKLLALPAVGTTEAERASRREYIGRAHREIDLLGHCVCPELVKLGSLAPREVSIDNIDYLGYSEEFLEGRSLQDYISNGGLRATEGEIKKLLSSLLRAIRELWTFEVVHRDIKPLNIILTGNPGRPYVLLDLGIAYQTREAGLTVDPAIRPATVPYLAPEMLNINFRKSLDYRADVYTAGISAFEYATFRHPLVAVGEDPLRTISRVMRQNPTPLNEIRPDLSDDLCKLIDQMMKKSPPLRPSNLNALINRLEQ